MSFCPSRVPGEYLPSPKTTSEPVVYAFACSACADCEASGSVWTRTRLKSKPKRGSMDARVSASSGRPGDCTVSCTSCGASLETCGSDASRCTQACGPRVLLRSERLARSSAKPGGLRDLDRKPQIGRAHV